MMLKMKNKRGEVLPRDVIFMIFIFSGIIALSSILVNQMGNEYDNAEMVSSYNQDTIGENTLTTKGNDWEKIGDDLSGENGIGNLLLSGLSALGGILLAVLEAPRTFAVALTSLLDVVGASEGLRNIATFILSGILYSLIAFGIAKVFLRGGDI